MEVLIPDSNGSLLKNCLPAIVPFESDYDGEEFGEQLGRLIGDKKCWNLIDFRKKGNQSSVHVGANCFKCCFQIMFASPDNDRWCDLWFTDAETKGQEPTLCMPVWTGVEFDALWEMTDNESAIRENITPAEELEILVSLFVFFANRS